MSIQSKFSKVVASTVFFFLLIGSVKISMAYFLTELITIINVCLLCILLATAILTERIVSDSKGERHHPLRIVNSFSSMLACLYSAFFIMMGTIIIMESAPAADVFLFPITIGCILLMIANFRKAFKGEVFRFLPN